jgi:hypothetical protein
MGITPPATSATAEPPRLPVDEVYGNKPVDEVYGNKLVAPAGVENRVPAFPSVAGSAELGGRPVFCRIGAVRLLGAYNGGPGDTGNGPA